MQVENKDLLEEKLGVLYQVPCSCSSIYIGKTKRTLETRIKEHMAAIRQGEMEKSAIAEHAWSQHHPILWEETSAQVQTARVL